MIWKPKGSCSPSPPPLNFHVGTWKEIVGESETQEETGKDDEEGGWRVERTREEREGRDDRRRTGVDRERGSKIESYEPEGLSMVADSTSEPEAGCGGRRRGFKWKLRPIRRNRRHGYRRLRPDVPHKRTTAPLHTYANLSLSLSLSLSHSFSPSLYLNISAACLCTYGMCKYLLHTYL